MKSPDSQNVALVLWVTTDQVRILFHDEERDIVLPGKWRLSSPDGRPVAPGDLVRVTNAERGLQVAEVLPRKNEFTRKVAGERTLPQIAAVNLDHVFVMASIASPRTSLGLIDRLLVTASIGGVPASLLVNKSDLVTTEELDALSRIYRLAGVPVYLMSLVNDQGVKEVAELLESKTTLLAGPSGVGKTSFTNRLQPGLDLKVGAVSIVTGKGRHVTTTARLHRLGSDGWLIDTPGLRECLPWGITKKNLVEAFPEFDEVLGQCKFRNCKHKDELGCAILEKLKAGEIADSRYDTYRKLLDDAIRNERKY